MLGFPIRTPPDQRSVANSPGHFAGSHVLHRLSMPRHPPCALNNLPTTNHQHTQQTPPTQPDQTNQPNPSIEASACTPWLLDGTRSPKNTQNNQTKQHTRQTPRTTTQPHQPPTPFTGTRDRMSCTACAECSYSRPLSKNQTTRSQPALPPHPGGMASDASDTQQRAIQAPPTPTPTNRRQTRARKHVVFH